MLHDYGHDTDIHTIFSSTCNIAFDYVGHLFILISAIFVSITVRIYDTHHNSSYLKFACSSMSDTLFKVFRLVHFHILIKYAHKEKSLSSCVNKSYHILVNFFIIFLYSFSIYAKHSIIYVHVKYNVYWQGYTYITFSLYLNFFLNVISSAMFLHPTCSHVHISIIWR